MNRYAEMRERQEAELDAFPTEFEFSDRRFAEGIAALGLTPEDSGRICEIPGGSFYLREYRQRLEEMADRHDAELRAAIAADETGDGFIYEAFLHELDIYEYGRTDDVTYALEALGFTAHEILNDPRLKRGFDKAVAEIRGRERPQP